MMSNNSVRMHLIRKFAEICPGISVEFAEDSPHKVMEMALERSIADLKENPASTDDVSVKQEELSKIASGDSDLSIRERAELFEDDDSEEVEELSESDKEKLQEELTERVFSDSK